MRRALPLTVVMIALLGCEEKPSTGPGKVATPGKPAVRDAGEKPTAAVKPAPKDTSEKPAEPKTTDPPAEKEKPAPKEVAWENFTSTEGKFSVSFPTKPKEEKDDGIRRFVVKLPTARYEVDYYDLTEEVIKEEGGPEGYIKFKSEFSPDNRKSTRTFKLHGHPACERVHDTIYEDEGSQPSVTHIREVLVGVRIYELSVEMVKGKEDARARERFFDSFKLAR